jgi:hypothetical protein
VKLGILLHSEMVSARTWSQLYLDGKFVLLSTVHVFLIEYSKYTIVVLPTTLEA